MAESEKSTSEVIQEAQRQAAYAEIAACTIGGVLMEAYSVYAVLQEQMGTRISGVVVASVGAVALTAASRTYFENFARSKSD